MSPARVQLTPRLAAMLAEQERVQVAKPSEPQKPSKADERAEAELQEDVIAYLRSAKGIRQIDVDHSRKGLTAGVPDLRFAYRGRAVFIELKNAKGRTTDAQEQDHERRRMDGAVGGVFRSIPEIKEFLDAMETNQENNHGQH